MARSNNNTNNSTENAWTVLSREPRAPDGVLTDAFVMKFDSHLDFALLSKRYKFSEELLRVYKHRVTWSDVLRRTVYPESFLREMTPHFTDCWSVVSRCQNLSEEFMHDYRAQLDWGYLRVFQTMSRDFQWKHMKYLSADRDSD